MHHVCSRKSRPLMSFLKPLVRIRALSTSTRTYADAIDALNTLQTPYHIVEARRKAGIRPDASSMREMKAYLRRIGYTPSDLNRLNIIHVAGTKGKGSTCAFVDSILKHHNHTLSKPLKTGLFISPHLIAVRERIRINSAPLPESLFAKYFFDIWDRLETNKTPDEEGGDGKPVYARYLTLMSWHVYLQEKVDVAVYETGIGGEFDATNLAEKPLASGITSLGIDHVFALGDTVGKIAWHKAGIMKSGSPAFSVEQVPEARKVLEERAVEKGVDLQIRGIDERLRGVRVTPDADFQKKNASLAVALAETALTRLGAMKTSSGGELHKSFVDGLEQTVFRGRCETFVEENVTWYIDGAHTMDSLKESSKWFLSASSASRPRILIFNQQGRSEATAFLEPISATVQPTFDLVIFCSNVTYASSGYKKDFVNFQYDKEEIDGLVQQKRFQETWKGLQKDADVRVVKTIEEALDMARDVGHQKGGVDVFATGSLHLVGGVLGILEKADAL